MYTFTESVGIRKTHESQLTVIALQTLFILALRSSSFAPTTPSQSHVAVAINSTQTETIPLKTHADTGLLARSPLTPPCEPEPKPKNVLGGAVTA